MEIRKFVFNKYTLGVALVLAGFIAGRFIFNKPQREKTVQEQLVKDEHETIWTCSMHPQIRMDHPGKCPICGMDLIPLVQNSAPVDPDAVVMTEEGIKLAEVQTTIVTRQKPVKEVRLYGKIQADERLIQIQPAHVPGRIEKLLVNFTGEEVKKGQVIAQIYSPELITAQEELLEAAKMKDMQPAILEAAREKLRQWKLTDKQIADIENTGIVKTIFDVTATVSGIVTSRRIASGDYVTQGTPLFEIADLSHVWALFDAYESDLPWIKKGDRIRFTLKSLPGKEFRGTISFIDPVIDPMTRVARVRVEMVNPDNTLKPEMFTSGIVEAQLTTGGKDLVIPQSAVLWTGTRSVVYIKLPEAKEPSFVIREITLGPYLNNNYVVLDGLKEGEEIVTNGTFSVDASAQLEGKPSMMNPGGGKTNSMPGMIMPGDTKTGTEENIKAMDMKPVNGNVKSETDRNNIAPVYSGTDINVNFKMQLNIVYDRYIVLKNAFVQSDEKQVVQYSHDFKQALAKVDMNLLKNEAMTKWMTFSEDLKNLIDKISTSDDLDYQRKTFSTFNDDFYKTLKEFGLMGKTVYYQFCPMMNDGNGAYWLSETKDIRNPYYGEAMLTCGETKETLNY